MIVAPCAVQLLNSFQNFIAALRVDCHSRLVKNDEALACGQFRTRYSDGAADRRKAFSDKICGNR